jgi:hypothetical protein
MIAKPSETSNDEIRIINLRKYGLTVRILPQIMDRTAPKVKGINSNSPVVT